MGWAMVDEEVESEMQEEILGDKRLAAPAGQLHPGSPIRRLWNANELSSSSPCCHLSFEQRAGRR